MRSVLPGNTYGTYHLEIQFYSVFPSYEGNKHIKTLENTDRYGKENKNQS